MIMTLGNNKQDFEVFLTNATKSLTLAKCHWRGSERHTLPAPGGLWLSRGAGPFLGLFTDAV